GIRDRTVTGVQTCALPISRDAIAAPGERHCERIGEHDEPTAAAVKRNEAHGYSRGRVDDRGRRRGEAVQWRHVARDGAHAPSEEVPVDEGRRAARLAWERLPEHRVAVDAEGIRRRPGEL